MDKNNILDGMSETISLNKIVEFDGVQVLNMTADVRSEPNSQMNYTSLKYLSESFLGTCVQMMEVWKQAKGFGVDTFELEERILVQMMFTGAELPGHFDIYLSYNQREPREYLKKAYLTYMSREAFVKNVELDS